MTVRPNDSDAILPDNGLLARAMTWPIMLRPMMLGPMMLGPMMLRSMVLRPVEKEVGRRPMVLWPVEEEVGREVVGVQRSSDNQQQPMSNMLYPWQCAWYRWTSAHEMGNMTP